MGIRDRLIAVACTKYDARSTIGNQRIKEMNESDTAGRVQTADAGKIYVAPGMFARAGN